MLILGRCHHDNALAHMDQILQALDQNFRELHKRSVRLISDISDELLYKRTGEDNDLMMKLTVGENIIRSSAFVEMNFGGITRRLWDDPFEWTLTEALNDRSKILAYLSEVESTRENGFRFVRADGDLGKMIPAPRDLRSLAAILIDTLCRAEHYQGRAFALYQTLSLSKLRPR